MNLLEIFEQPPVGYTTASQDQTVLKKDDKRKTRLTLDQLNRLRLMNDTRTLEQEKRLTQVSKQYAAPAEGTGGGLGM